MRAAHDLWGALTASVTAGYADAPKRRNALPIRKRINATEHKGVAYGRNVVEDANCVFKEIDRANDCESASLRDPVIFRGMRTLFEG